MSMEDAFYAAMEDVHRLQDQLAAMEHDRNNLLVQNEKLQVITACLTRIEALATEFHDLAKKPPESLTDTRLLCEGFAQRIDAALKGYG